MQGCSARAEMRPWSTRWWSSHRWLLRPRGDAPKEASMKTTSDAAAPPARRCAPRLQLGVDHEVGCSARAEMRPRVRPLPTCPRRLLRPRGDAPPGSLPRDPPGTAAPPARRCAPDRDRGHRSRRGCSARAEMRPAGRHRHGMASRLLRPRGDAPRADVPSACASSAAPPARRCAGRWWFIEGRALGCSARAEMRLTLWHHTRAGMGLLRPRGDAPHALPTPTLILTAAPPARRCARASAFRGAVAPGCSARAEMRRCRAFASDTTRWLLRPRGDAPRLAPTRPVSAWAAPPARRCARPRDATERRGRGCSARAEMRPCEATARS